MKKHLVAMALLLALVPAVAWAALGPTEKLTPGHVLRGRFVQEHPVKGIGNRIRSQGHFLIVPGKGVIWSVEKPIPLSVVVTPKGMVQSVGGVAVLRLSAAKMPFITEATDLLTSALEGDFKKLSGRFKIEESGKAKNWKVKLTPRSKDDAAVPFTSITAKGGKYVDAADVARPDGLMDKFDFSDQDIVKGPISDDEAILFDAATANAP